MSKLNFSPITEAFTLGSDQIRNTQEEIARLKQLMGNVELGKPASSVNPPNLPPGTPPNYQRIGQPDAVRANFSPPSANVSGSSPSDINFLEVVKHPQFDDIVKNYVRERHPNWVITDTQSVPRAVKENFQENFQENFGKRYSSTICSDIKNYIVFFIISLVMYMFLSLVIKK